MVEIAPEIIADLITTLGRIGLWIQAIGLIIILWIIFHIIIMIDNRLKRKKLYSIEERLSSIENKINRLLKNKK